jgi:putative flavoprotein involved in K+ transport
MHRAEDGWFSRRSARFDFLTSNQTKESPMSTSQRGTTERLETIVIGGGQAGLATAYHLKRVGRQYLVLESRQRIGDVWRQRFDSLRLFTPAKYDGLPGWGFPAPKWAYPTKDEVADYLEAYASRYEIPVRTGVTVESLTRSGDIYVLQCGARHFEAANVVIASGTWQRPKTPAFADQIDPKIRQLHSNEYRNPAQLQPGPVLVVGCSHSGADIALEVAGSHETTLSGPVRGEVPFAIEGRAAHRVLPIMWFMANHVLTEKTPIGRKMRAEVRTHGGPLLRVKRADLEEAGVTRFDAKTVSAEGGKPVLEDGRVLDVANIIWCTGFDKDTDWVKIPVTGEDGWPAQSQGCVPDSPGLYFVGLPFLTAFASMLVGGVGRDAERVATHIAARNPASAGTMLSA